MGNDEAIYLGLAKKIKNSNKMKTLKETQKLISDIQGILNAVCNDMMSVTSVNFPHRFASIRGCIHNCSEMLNDAINEKKQLLF